MRDSSRYPFSTELLNALASIQKVAEAHGLTMAEIALRWISHHSLMKREHGDAVIVGASSLNHIEQVRVRLCLDTVRTTLTAWTVN